MLGRLLPPFVRRATTLAVLALGACHIAPTEAPPPDAGAAWPEQGPPLEPLDDPAARSGSPEDASPSRPRPPQTIFGDELQRATGPGPAYLLRQLGPEPYRHEGHFVGWEITRLFPDDPQLCADGCDLALGDVILGVNGKRLQTPQELSDTLEALPRWTQMRVQSLRQGKRRDITYVIVRDAG